MLKKLRIGDIEFRNNKNKSRLNELEIVRYYESGNSNESKECCYTIVVIEIVRDCEDNVEFVARFFYDRCLELSEEDNRDLFTVLDYTMQLLKTEIRSDDE